MKNNIPDFIPDRKELNARLDKFISEMNLSAPDWDTALIFGKVNQYYFTGTMQDGFVCIQKSGRIFYFVRRSYKRALLESSLNPQDIYEISSYRDTHETIGKKLKKVYIDKDTVTLSVFERFGRYFEIDSLNSLDIILSDIRSIKTPFELDIIKYSGRLHEKLLIDIAPSLLYEGISETDFSAVLFKEMVSLGYQGVSRFSMFQTDMAVGQVGFGDSSIYPTAFDGPGGNRGIYTGAPYLGSRDRLLQRGDLVFIDIAFGVAGYHSDKTVLYSFGETPPAEAVKAHGTCLKIQETIKSKLLPGAVPSEIYSAVMESLDKSFVSGFMGMPGSEVKFLGHGVGLNVDEYPIITKNFNKPLRENMVLAVEPKKAIPGYGLVGTEDTFVVTESGGQSITGKSQQILVI